MNQRTSEESPAPRHQSARKPWVFGLVGLLLGMGIMWVVLEVNFRHFIRSESSTPDELARAAFKALKANNFDSFVDHVPDERDLGQMLAHIREHGDASSVREAEQALRARGGLSGMASKQMQRNTRHFETALRNAATEELDWSHASYGGLDAERMRLKERQGIMGGDVYFLVQAAGRSYLFKLDDCAFLGGVWLCGSGVRFRQRLPLDAPVRTRPEVDVPVVGVPEVDVPDAGAAPLEVPPAPKAK